MKCIASAFSNSATDGCCIAHAGQCIVVCSSQGRDGELDYLDIARVAVECAVDRDDVLDNGRDSVRTPVQDDTVACLVYTSCWKGAGNGCRGC
jgi:hypothetical protein